MTPEQFAYWLQGYAELSDGTPTPEQWQAIKEHLALVFKKVTAPLPSPAMPFAPNALKPDQLYSGSGPYEPSPRVIC